MKLAGVCGGGGGGRGAGGIISIDRNRQLVDVFKLYLTQTEEASWLEVVVALHAIGESKDRHGTFRYFRWLVSVYFEEYLSSCLISQVTRALLYSARQC